MRRLYNILFTFFLCLSAPYYLWKMWRRGNWMADFGQRFGRYNSKVKQSVTNRQIIWLHAVSVGEVNICTQLIRALERRVPSVTLAVSTTTSTGMGELQRKLPSHILKVYYPIDRHRWVQRAYAILQPHAIVLVEAEIWPNFLWRAKQQKVPVFLVNARLSDRSFRGYKRFRSLFEPLFNSFAGVGCQNETDAKKLVELGCKSDAVRVVGNLKYDAAELNERRVVDVPRLLQQLGVPPGARLLVAGSTHRGEEGILAEIFKRLRTRFPELFLVIVPRHHERGRKAARDIAAKGVKFVYRTEVTADRKFQPDEIECLLVNTTGELKCFYEHASVVFVGKSLTAQGGQNPIEPAMMSKPIVFGPNMQNFHAITEALVSRQGARQVADAAGLEKALEELLADQTHAAELGRNARLVVQENLGSIERTVEMILEKLQGKEIFIAPAK